MSASDVIARLRELRAKATAGRLLALPDNPKSDKVWRVSDGEDFVCQLFSGHGEFDNAKANAAAIVAAMNSLPALLECASVLADIAAQKTGAELDEDQYEHADFEGGYGIVIDKARAALQALAEGGGE
jgi:hypothetical protein